MSSGAEVTCPYHDHTESVPGVPYVLECGCKCMQAFDREEDALAASESEGGQVATFSPDGATKHVVVLYIPTVISTP